MTVSIVQNGYIAPVVGPEIANGYVVAEDNVITAVGAGAPP